MIQTLLLGSRLVVTPPFRHVAIPRFNAPGLQLGEYGGRPAHGAEQLLAAMSSTQARGGSVQMNFVPRKSNRDIALAAVHQSGDALRYASAELQGDREVVLAAVRQYGDALRHASSELQANREVVLAAVQQEDGSALVYASAELKADREVVLTAVHQSGHALRYASAELRADRQIVLAAAHQNERALVYASAELKADREVMLAAVHQNGHALEHASPELRADRQVVLAAVYQKPLVLRHASAELQRDDAVFKASNHAFVHLDRLADQGRLKVLRTEASVRECGDQMKNCLAGYDFAMCGSHILVKLDGDDGTPLAVGSFAENGEWDQIRYAYNRDAKKGGGSRACGRGSAAALPSASTDVVFQQFEAFLPALQAFQLELRAQ